MKKVLTTKALAALTAGEPVTKGVEPTAEELALAAELAADLEAENAAAKEPEGDLSPEAVQLAELTAEVDVLKESIEATATAHAAELEALNTSNEEKLRVAVGASDTMKGILCGQIDKMRIALGLQAVDHSEFTAESILTEFNTKVEAFNKLPVGSVIPETTNKQTAKNVQTNIDESNRRSVGWN